MLYEIFITLECLALVFFGLNFTKMTDLKTKDLLAYFLVMVFFFLAMTSFNIQTENCAIATTEKSDAYNYMCYECQGLSVPSLATENSSALISSISTTYTVENTCAVTSYNDTTLVYFNFGLAFLSLTYGLGMTFMRGLKKNDDEA